MDKHNGGGIEDGSDRDSAESFSQLYHSWRYLFWLLGLTGLIALFYAEENWRGQRAWRKYTEQLTARGESFDPASFIPPRVADDENFAMTPALAPLFDFVPGTQQWRSTNSPRLFQSLAARYEAAGRLVKTRPLSPSNSWVRARMDLVAWAGALEAGTNRTDREAEPLLATNFSGGEAAAAVLRGLADFEPVLAELREASRRPHSRFNIHYEQDDPASILLPHLSKIKEFCQVLQLRAVAELSLGRSQDALEDLKLMLYLTNATRDEPILISQLVRMSEFQLALQPLAEGMGRWSEPQLRDLQDHLQRFDFLADAEHALKAERTVFGGGIIEWVRRSPKKMQLIQEFESMSNNDAGAMWPVGALLVAAPGGWLYLEQRNQSRAFDDYLLPLIDVTNHLVRPDSVQKADDAIQQLAHGSQMQRFLRHELFCGLLLPSISRVAQKAAFAQTAVDTAVLACAIERYRLAKGQLPDSLEKLSPDFINKVPADVVNGQNFRYRAESGEQYVLYSIGWNLKDDGGSVHRTKGGDPEPREGDWVWGSF